MSGFGPQQVGGEYYSRYWRKHYVVLGMTDTTIAVDWEDGQRSTHMTAWHESDDMLVRRDGTGRREYSTDGRIWHFAPGIARSLAAVGPARPPELNWR